MSKITISSIGSLGSLTKINDAVQSLTAEWLIAVKHENLIHDGTHKRSRYHHGVIAQEIAGVIAESGVDFGGYQDHKVNGGEDVLTIAYSELIGPLIKALQEVNQKFDALKQEFDDYVEQY